MSRYRRDWIIGVCGYRLQQQEKYALIIMYALISGY